MARYAHRLTFGTHLYVAFTHCAERAVLVLVLVQYKYLLYQYKYSTDTTRYPTGTSCTPENGVLGVQNYQRYSISTYNYYYRYLLELER